MRERESAFGSFVTLIRSKIVLNLLVSSALLGPCFCRPSNPAGDLPSHVYNAWLATLIEQGRAPGLWIAHQWTNVLFDEALSRLLRTVGVALAQSIAVGIAVLVFFWGAFAFVCTVSRKQPWFIAPCLAVLAYGYVFQKGLFNFYLSAGVSFIALALLWRDTLIDRIMAAPLVVLASLAHVLPVVWLVAVVMYVWIARKIFPKFQMLSFLLSIAALVLLRQFLLGHFRAHWSERQLLFITGADQVWVFGRQYWLVAVMILFLWVALFWLGHRGTQIVSQIPLQVYLLTAAGIALLPRSINFASYHQPLSLIAERMSLFSGVLACTVAGTAKPKRWHGVGFALVAAIYFFFWYEDAHAVHRIENQVESLVSQLPVGQRVLALPALRLDHGYQDAHPVGRIEHQAENFFIQLPAVWRLASLPGPRVGLDHIADRVCIDRCFSYGNYEPSSAAFRVRALPGNPIVVWDSQDLTAMTNGTYVVKEHDLPIYQIYYCGPGFTDVCIRPLKAGETNSVSHK